MEGERGVREWAGKSKSNRNFLIDTGYQKRSGRNRKEIAEIKRPRVRSQVSKCWYATEASPQRGGGGVTTLLSLSLGFHERRGISVQRDTLGEPVRHIKNEKWERGEHGKKLISVSSTGRRKKT